MSHKEIFQFLHVHATCRFIHCITYHSRMQIYSGVFVNMTRFYNIVTCYSGLLSIKLHSFLSLFVFRVFVQDLILFHLF